MDWGAVALGLGFTLVLAVPTLAIEEDWHGRPMIDEHGAGWLVPLVLVALAFIVGGALAARRTHRAGGAVAGGAVVGTAAVAVLVVADAIRRAAAHKLISPDVVHLWAAAAIGSIFLAALGGFLGRRQGKTVR